MDVSRLTSDCGGLAMKYVMLLISLVLGCHAMRSEPRASTAPNAFVVSDRLSPCGCTVCQCKVGECNAEACPTFAPAPIPKPEPKPVSVLVKPPAPKPATPTQEVSKPAPVYSEPLQTPVRQTQSPRYEWRTYTQRGRFGRTSTYQRYELVDGEAAAPVYRGSMCGPGGCR